MVCDICGKEGARTRKVSRTFGKGTSLFVIENIPFISCPNCGENYLSADTLHEIEKLKLHRRNLSISRAVGIMSFV